MKENKHISLEEIGSELPFSVPDNYFEQFAARMDELTHPKSVSVHRFRKAWLYMAAMFGGVIFAAQFFYNRHQSDLARNAENYELYVISQVDENTVLDYYETESAK